MRAKYMSENYRTTDREELLHFFPEEIEIHNIINTTRKTRQQDALALICRINPYCILDFSNEYAPISYYYSQNYPTIFLHLKKPGYSSSFFHKYAFVQDGRTQSVYPPITEEQVIYMAPPIERNEPTRIFAREDYGFDADNVVVITVGNRIQYEISNNLAEQMCNLLLSNEKIKWLLVGCTELSYINHKYYDLVGKSVIFIEYETNLPGLYKICDIYLNPNRAGGGFSIAWAMQQGLAVASPLSAAAGDTLIGQELSVKKEDYLAPYIAAMADEPTLLKRNKNAMLDIASKWSIDAYINNLIAGMNELTQDFPSCR